jgi:hypothetical protein
LNFEKETILVQAMLSSLLHSPFTLRCIYDSWNSSSYLESGNKLENCSHVLRKKRATI